MTELAQNRPRLLNWPLLPYPDADGRMTFPTLEQSVRDSIEIILRTRPGERLMRPHFGGGLENFLHEQNTLATRHAIQEMVITSIGRWEDRVLLDRVDVWQVEDELASIRIEIAYRIRRTNESKQMSITMTLEA